jgi:hypothetical protein
LWQGLLWSIKICDTVFSIFVGKSEVFHKYSLFLKRKKCSYFHKQVTVHFYNKSKKSDQSPKFFLDISNQRAQKAFICVDKWSVLSHIFVCSGYIVHLWCIENQEAKKKINARNKIDIKKLNDIPTFASRSEHDSLLPRPFCK